MSQKAFPLLGILALGVVAYQQSKLGNFPPPPAAFVGVALIFTLLAFVSLASPQLAAALSVAVVIWLVFSYHGVLAPANTAPTGGTR